MIAGNTTAADKADEVFFIVRVDCTWLLDSDFVISWLACLVATEDASPIGRLQLNLGQFRGMKTGALASVLAEPTVTTGLR